MFDEFSFTPTHQPTPERPVSFTLRPLDMGSLHSIQVSVNRIGDASWTDYSSIFTRNVRGWAGIDKDCTPQVKRDILAGEVDRDFYAWIKEIGECLYQRAMLGEPARKNS
jgi:hypothetical protein